MRENPTNRCFTVYDAGEKEAAISLQLWGSATPIRVWFSWTYYSHDIFLGSRFYATTAMTDASFSVVESSVRNLWQHRASQLTSARVWRSTIHPHTWKHAHARICEDSALEECSAPWFLNDPVLWLEAPSRHQRERLENVALISSAVSVRLGFSCWQVRKREVKSLHSKVMEHKTDQTWIKWIDKIL